MMLLYVILVACCCCQVKATEQSPKIIIVGAGVSGIAAATRLFENGFNNITILEAENRIGGRIYTTEFGGYMVDLGGQWVHGEADNAAYEMAWPLGLIEHSFPNRTSKFFSSSEPSISKETLDDVLQHYITMVDTEIPVEYENKSTGDYYKPIFDRYFEAHPDITTEQRTSILNMLNLVDMAFNAGDSWYNISAFDDYIICKGDQHLNWKDRGYSTILDILMKKYPNPADELPVMNNTILNAEVSQINYDNSDGGVRVITANGNEYQADHVIVTTSIAVLRADHKTMFNPQLSEVKVNAMKGLELGHVVKLLLVYDEPWWLEENVTFNTFLHLYWTEKDRNEIANDPEKSWMLGLAYACGVENKPRLLLIWVTGPRAREMETVPEERVFSQTKEILHRFFGRAYNLTEPTAMLRSQWYTNKHFRGTWSYRSPEYKRSGTKITDLSDPIVKDGKPVVLFAGEITHPTHFGTVQGGMGSGWREAERLKKLYDKDKSTTALNQS